MPIDHPDFRATRDRRIHGSTADSRERFAERLRGVGASREDAARIAAEASDKLARDLDRGSGGGAPVGGSGTRSPYRVRFDWEAPEAGIALDEDRPRSG